MSLIQIIMRNFGPFFWFTGVLLTLPAWGQVHAEVECSSEVFYTWTKNLAEPEQGIQGGGAPAEGAAVPGAGQEGGPPAADGGQGTPVNATGVGPDGKVQTVRFFLVQRKGSDEAAAKNALQLEVQRQKTRAAERCKRAHESTGECLTTKLSIKSSTLNSLSFSARAQAERAIVEECQVQQGRCLSVDAAPVACRELLSAGPAVDASGNKAKAPAAAAAAKPDAKAKDGAAKPAPKKK